MSRTPAAEPVEPAHARDTARAQQLSAARARFGKLRGRGGDSGQMGTDALMRLLRCQDEDAADPGFAGAPLTKAAKAAHRK